MANSVILVAGLIALAGCTANAGRADSATSTRADSSGQDTSAVSAADCVRGEPERMLASAGAGAAARFERTGKLGAVEDLDVNDTTSLRITHSGCAHYTETYSFTIGGATRDTTDSDYWLEQGAALLRSLPMAETRTSQVDQLATALTAEAGKADPYTYGAPISVPELTTITVSVTRKADGVLLEIIYDVAL